MSIECGECERDLRGGHDPGCSRYRPEGQEGPTLTIANLTDKDVEVRVIRENKGLTTLLDWTGADTLEQSLAVAEEVVIGPTWEEELSEMARVGCQCERCAKPTDPPPPREPEEWAAVLGGGTHCPDGSPHAISAAAPRPIQGDTYCWRCGTQVRPVPPREPRFGDRLREYVAEHAETIGRHTFNLGKELLAVADDIDIDEGGMFNPSQVADLMHDQRRDYRRKVEEAVERLAYSAVNIVGDEGEDVVRVEPLLAELDRIFGARS